MTDILDYWPVQEYEPRISQIQALKWLEKQTAKYIFLEAPVGFGKSLVGLTYSRFLNNGKGDAYILTPQIILQQQYENEQIDDNNSIFSIYGKSNYTCPRFNTTCDIGSLLKKCKSNCSYSKAIKKSNVSNNLVMNYALGLLMFGYTDVYDKRKLMICDEAHNLESMLVNFNLLSISKNRADQYNLKLKKFNNIHDGFKFLEEEYYPKVEEELDELHEEVKYLQDMDTDKLNPDQLKIIKKYDRLLNHIHSISDFINQYKDTYHIDYVMISTNMILEFKPVYGKDNFRKMLNHKAEKFLFMSGTILDKKQRCEDLGLPEEETAYLRLDSEFNADNRPVVYIPTMKMNASWKNDENEEKRGKYLEVIDLILKLHNNESGIIHTGNFQISEFIVNHLRHQKDFRIYHHNPESGNDRNSIIDQFLKDTKSRILVSPSITEGLDLKYDKGRFAIIGKVPYGYLGDTWIKKRLEMSESWYAMEAAKDILQGCGRIVRSNNDYGTTYIIDESWNYFYYKNSSLFPKWWKEAYKKL